MNIMIIMLLVMLDEEIPELPEYSRANRRAARDKYVARNKRSYTARCHGENGHWAENPDEDGVYRSYHSGHIHHNAQTGRWATERLSGHRRYQKWCRDAYPSFTDEKATARWEEELKEFFGPIIPTDEELAAAEYAKYIEETTEAAYTEYEAGDFCLLDQAAWAEFEEFGGYYRW